MSHLGLGLLYGILNREDTIWAERAYAPAPDLEAELRRQGRPLTSLESGTPLSAVRPPGGEPPIRAGLHQLAQHAGAGRRAPAGGGARPRRPGGGGRRPHLLQPRTGGALSATRWSWATAKRWCWSWPRWWRPGSGAAAAAGNSGRLWKSWTASMSPPCLRWSLMSGATSGKSIPGAEATSSTSGSWTTSTAIPVSPRALVPYCQIVHDRLNIEIARGCTRGCRYCQAGMIYRPVRERQAVDLLDWTETALAATGYEELSLLTLSAGDYASLTWLITSLMDRLAAKQVAVSLPSLRADTLTPEILAPAQAGAAHRPDPGPGGRHRPPAPGDQQEPAGRGHPGLGPPGLRGGLAPAEALLYAGPAH